MTVRTIGTSTSSTRSVASLLRRIRTLPADPAVDDPRKWYRTQKEHWIGWLAQYDGPGAYGRRTDVVRDARYAYNHIVEPAMLLYLAKSAGIDRRRVCAARLAAVPPRPSCKLLPRFGARSAGMTSHVRFGLRVRGRSAAVRISKPGTVVLGRLLHRPDRGCQRRDHAGNAGSAARRFAVFDATPLIDASDQTTSASTATATRWIG